MKAAIIGRILVLIVLAMPFAHAQERPVAATPARPSFERSQVERGARLAAIGNCLACHTTQGGKPYAGGVAVQTPFGTIHSTNITPDVATGIGAWSEDDFRRAMREGISRDGHHLYPAFPYNYFSRMTDEDIGALYALMMTRDPVAQRPPANALKFPFGFRPLVALWNLFFLDARSFEPKRQESAQWNRGAYLAEGLAHCGACHTPRNALGGEEKGRHFDGSAIQSWYAPALNARSPSPQAWTVDELSTYLRTGIVSAHAIAAGPMQSVVHGLERADLADVEAIATYVTSLQQAAAPGREARARASLARAQAGTLAAPSATPAATKDEAWERSLRLGAAVYTNACASCHDAGRGIDSGRALNLSLAVAVYEPDPRSLIHLVLDGVAPRAPDRGRWMPGFAGLLTEEQVAALLAYLRRYAADLPPWDDLKGAVREAQGG